MSSFVIELEEEEIDNICLALAHATIKNDNKQAVEELDKLCEKLLRYASSTTAIAVKNYENVGEQTMRDKQIEEMAKVIKSSLDGLGSGNFNFTGDEISTMFAKALYNAGYRKASDVVPREEVEYLKKENRYLRDRLAEEMEHAKDMKGIDDIVRCKECIFCKYNSSALTYRCDRRGYYPEEVKESGFCSYGRRTDDEV